MHKRTNTMTILGAVLLAGFLALPAGAQNASGLSGVWVADPADQNFDIYGEVRLVHEENDAIVVAMLDFGVGWQEEAGAYVGRLAIMPWTFRFGRWGPRRGPDDSKAPQGGPGGVGKTWFSPSGR